MRTFERDTDGFLERICPEMKSLLLAVVLVAGCTKPNPDACSDGNCTDPAKPFCDVDGTLGGSPGTCIAVSCTAGQFKECQGDRALTCNAGGNNYDLVACPNGCGDTGCKDPPPMVDAPPCTTLDCMKHIVPKFLPSVCDSLATAPNAKLDITADYDLDTGTTACQQIIAQNDGPDICLMHFGSITIEAGVTFLPHGSRVIALVADADISIKGILDVSAEAPPNLYSAPGAGYTGTHAQSGTSPSNAGGGGAGNRTNGANGGTTTVDGGGNDFGAQEPSPASLNVLLPGTHAGFFPSAGGGATLISCRAGINIPSTGVIDAAGGYGNVSDTQASGGGSGGNVVLQGMTISISGSMFSNGGSGAEGGGLLNTTPGSRGGRTTSPALGGASANNGGDGGNGGALSQGPTAGKKGTNGATGGGGGGSTGYLLTYTPPGVVPTINTTTAVFSPALEANNTLPTN